MADSADNFSESVSNMELLERARMQFNAERKIVIKMIPNHAIEEDISEFVQFPAREVTISRHSDQAVVTLEDPTTVEVVVSKLNQTKLLSQTVTVAVYSTDKLLCIANLPPDLPEYKFRELVTAHGTIDKCFLMRSEETGESKGYGFVEYSEPIEKIGPIKVKMDGREIGGHTVHCDAVTDTTATGLRFTDLHSRCLIIDNLPREFKESMDLRTIFSQPNKPVYCQIVTKESESLGFGVIEYGEADEAEMAYNKLRDHTIAGTKINLAYCIPSKSAVHVVNRILFKYGDNVPVRKSSLLPDPVYPNPAFLNHPFFKNLVAKMPKLVVQFTEQLLHLQEGYVHNLENKTNAKPGILGPAPSIPMSPLMDVSLQLGLLALIALDQKQLGAFTEELPEAMQGVRIPTADDSQQTKAESLLGDPMTAQANMVLKNLLACNEKSEFGGNRDDGSEPKLLGKPVRSFNMALVTGFGRLMAMSSEKTQQKGLLGTGPPEPLMDKVVTSPNTINSLLGSLIGGRMGGGNMGNMANMNTNMANRQRNLVANNPNVNNMGKFGNMGNNFGNTGPNIGNLVNQLQNNVNNYQQRELQRVLEGMKNTPESKPPSLLGVFPNAKGDMKQQGLLGESPVGNANPAAKFMNTVQSLAMQKLSAENQGNPQQILNALFGNKTGNNDLTALLGNLTAQKAQNQNVGGAKGGLEKPPSLIDMNLRGHGDGLMPTPGQSGSGYGSGSSAARGGGRGYDGEGNQGHGGYGGAGAGNSGRGDNYGSMSGGGNYGGQNGQQRARPGQPTPMRQQSLLGAGPQYGADKQGDDEYRTMADQAAAYAAQTDANYRNQYNYTSNFTAGSNSEYSGDYQDHSDSGYRGNGQGRGSGAGQQGGATSSYGGANSGYSGSNSGNGGANSGYGGANSGYGGANSGYSGSNSGYGGSATGNGGNTAGYGSSGSSLANSGQDYDGSFSGYGDNNMGNNYNAGNSMGTGVKRGLDSMRYDGNNMYSANTPSRDSSGNNVPSLMGKYGISGANKPAYGYSGSGMAVGSRQGTMGPPLPPGQQSLLGTPPQGLKRGSTHMLPSPEPSPEGNYIGQHSQGLGGHYAESYVKRQKLNNLFSGHS